MKKHGKKKGTGSVDDGLQYVPVVDGGWGWVVVVGSFFIHVFADGIVYSFGILLEIIMKEFDSSNAKASVIISLLTGLTLGAGPIASAITNKFGCRVTTILGSWIATLGCAASYFATSVEYLMVSVGCVMGLGFGLMYCPAIVIVTMYFEKKRAMATGIAVCGAGIGTVLFAPISEALIKAFSWRIVFVVYSVVVLLCSACGATFRPLEFIAVADDKDASKDDDLEKIKKENADEASSEDDEKVPLSSDLHNASSQQELDNHDGEQKKRRDSASTKAQSRSRTVSESTGFITVKDVFYTGSIANLPPTDSHDRHRSLISLSIPEEKSKQLQELAKEAVEDPKDGGRARELWRTFSKMTDLSLLLEPIFVLYAVSNLLTSIAFNSPLVFLPAHAINLGCTPAQAARILSAFGFMNTVGRIMVGVISDRQLPVKFGKDTARNRLWFYNISLSVCGILTACVFVCNGFITLAVYSGLFGLTLSSYVCLTSVLLVDLIGIERLTNAFGLILLFQGVGTVIGPPISGRLADITGSYNMSFVFCGISLLISGLMLFMIPKLSAKKRKNELSNNVEV